MLIYSETSKIFIQRVREEIRSLFFVEIEKILPVKFQKSRISFKQYQYPLNIVVFEDNSRLGYFDYRYYEIGISKKLMYMAFDEVLKNIIRHELAHYLCFLFHGPDHGHGEIFRQMCNKLHWNENVFRAYSNLNLENKSVLNPKSINEELISKVKKLLNLQSSDNPHESQQATLRANKLILDYNLNLIQGQNQETDIYLVRVLESKKKNAKLLSIYEIIKTFYVSAVFNHGKSNVYLEIIGEKTNVTLAEYTALYLDSELDRLWSMTKKENKNLKGTAAKNSFFRGIAKGYLEKIKMNIPPNINSNELIVIEKNLQKNLQIVYPRLSSSYSSSLKQNQSALELGKIAGKNMSIRPGLKSQSTIIYSLE